jgi:acetyl esterase/lipase
MIRSILTAIALSVSALAAAQLPSPIPEISAGNTRVDHYPAHTANFPNGVQGIPSVIYWQPIGYRALTLDLYLPPGSVPRPATGFPLVVYIHGGAWLGGDAHLSGPFVDFPGVLASLSARGYVVASVEYRLSGEAKFPAQVQDVKAAIGWLRINASKYGIDPARAMTWGVSAGGYLAGLAAVSCNAAGLEPKQTGQAHAPAPVADSVTSSNVSDCVQGAVTWFGVFDMATIGDQAKEDKAMSRDAADAPEWQLLGCFGNNKCDPKRIASASPVTYVDKNSSPMLLIVGTEDTLVPYHQTLEMAEKLKSAGIRHELIVLPGINHGFIGKTPEETRDANLKALDATFRFIDQTIGSASGKSGQR